MAKKQSAIETLQQAKERGSEKDTEIINGDLVHTKLQPAVARNYQSCLTYGSRKLHRLTRENHVNG